jgi:hypothetical protein
MSDLAGSDHAGDYFALIVFDINQDRRARWVEIPDIVWDVLEVTHIFAAIEIKRYERLRVEIVARPN